MKTPGTKHHSRYIIFSKQSDFFLKTHCIFPGVFEYTRAFFCREAYAQN
jgi:hypothetical protein